MVAKLWPMQTDCFLSPETRQTMPEQAHPRARKQGKKQKNNPRTHDRWGSMCLDVQDEPRLMLRLYVAGAAV